MTSNEPAPEAVEMAETAVSAVLADADADWPDGVSPVLDQAFDAGTLYALRSAVQAHATRLACQKPGPMTW